LNTLTPWKNCGNKYTVGKNMNELQKLEIRKNNVVLILSILYFPDAISTMLDCEEKGDSQLE
jgi:hypothetical protein